ncbi:MAG: hypothetical protein QM756_38980 [Polyangiaceae bacterium]
MGVARIAILFVPVAWLLGCAETQRALPQLAPSAPQGAQAAGIVTVLASEADGLKVFWHGPTGRSERPPNVSVGWAATSAGDLQVLWKDLGRPEPLPLVDFSRYVVLGAGEPSGVCPGNLLAVDAEPGGVLRTRGSPSPAGCVSEVMQAAQIVAIPRRVAHGRVVFVPFELHNAYVFNLPEP